MQRITLVRLACQLLFILGLLNSEKDWHGSDSVSLDTAHLCEGKLMMTFVNKEKWWDGKEKSSGVGWGIQQLKYSSHFYVQFIIHVVPKQLYWNGTIKTSSKQAKGNCGKKNFFFNGIFLFNLIVTKHQTLERGARDTMGLISRRCMCTLKAILLWIKAYTKFQIAKTVRVMVHFTDLCLWKILLR